MHLRPRLLASTFLLGLTLFGSSCERDLTFAEMRAAIQETVLQGQAQTMVNDVVEISTTFTIGQAVSDIRDEIRTFAESQVPCSTVTLDGDSGLIIDFGQLGDACSYNGHTYAGVVTISVALDGNDVLVTHDYSAFRNEQIQLDGSVNVTWGGGARHIVSDLMFQGDDNDGQPHTLDVQADRTMTFVDPMLGLEGGVKIDGWREWQGDSGDNWHLDINGVEIRGADPVPQAGDYQLTTPREVNVTLSFQRIDDTTIEVTLTGPRRQRVFDVSSSGDVS